MNHLLRILLRSFASLAFVLTLLQLPGGNFPLASAALLHNPTHLVDTIWEIPGNGRYESIAVDITPHLADGTDGYYFANNFSFTDYNGNQHNGGYGGLQTNGHNGDTWIGKMAIFSVWNTYAGTAEANGWGVTFGGEGTGYSVRIPYEWEAGTTYRLTFARHGSNAKETTWGASITDLNSGVVTQIGSIRVPSAWGLIHNPITFHERYSGPTGHCQDIQPSLVSFSNMTADGSLAATSWQHYHIASAEDCPGLTWLGNIEGGYQSGINTKGPLSSPASDNNALPADQPAPPSRRFGRIVAITAGLVFTAIAGGIVLFRQRHNKRLKVADLPTAERSLDK